jgi:hypothetical protein
VATELIRGYDDRSEVRHSASQWQSALSWPSPSAPQPPLTRSAHRGGNRLTFLTSSPSLEKKAWEQTVGKGWEFFWLNKRYCVGAPDAPTARKFLREQYPDVAQHARTPNELGHIVVLGLELQTGVIRVNDFKGKSDQ